MKKSLLKNKFLSFSALVFLLGAFNVSQAQNLWTGGAGDNLFMTAGNWTAAPLFDGSDNLKIGTATNPVTLNNATAISVTQFQTSPGTELTITSDITSTSTSANAYIGGKLHITAGTFSGKGNIYFGNSIGETPYCNVETGGTLKIKAAILVGRSVPATIDVNGGTITGETGSTPAGAISIGNYTNIGPGILNLNSGLIKLFKVSSFTIGTFGTCNVNGGKLEEPAGDLVVKGTLNVNGGLVNLLAGASTINTSTLVPVPVVGTINLNSGKITIGGTLSTINTVINVDSGVLELTGDQTTTMADFIKNNVIKLSTAATTAGKTLTNTYDPITLLTTIKATSPLSIQEFADNNSFSIYPNPSTDGKFTISSNGLEGAKLSIHNILGQAIYNTTVGTGSSSEVSPNKSLNSGVYFVQLEKEGNTVTKKLIVK
jgi:hypothetical protein